MFKAHRLVYHSTLGSRVIKKKKVQQRGRLFRVPDPVSGGGYGVERFRGGLVFKAHRLLYHSTLGLSLLRGPDPVPGVQGYLAHKKTPPPLGPP